MHNRARIFQALLNALDLVDGMGVVRIQKGAPLDPSIRISCQVSCTGERSSIAAGDPATDPMLVLLDRESKFEALIEVSIPKVLNSIIEFEDQIVASCESRVATSQELRDLADLWYISATDFEYAQDRLVQTVTCTLEWTVHYQTSASEPGIPIA